MRLLALLYKDVLTLPVCMIKRRPHPPSLHDQPITALNHATDSFIFRIFLICHFPSFALSPSRSARYDEYFCPTNFSYITLRLQLLTHPTSPDLNLQPSHRAENVHSSLWRINFWALVLNCRFPINSTEPGRLMLRLVHLLKTSTLHLA